MAVATSEFYPELLKQLPSMAGKTVAVTGCTSGTGIIFAKTVASLGAKTILLNRPSPRADSALETVKAAAASEAEVIAVSCSLTSFKSVKEAASTVKGLCPDGLDVLCNNAGVMMMEKAATEDGLCSELQTNHLSHFLLTAELYPLLEAAANSRGDARIVNHSSSARQMPFMLSSHIGIDPVYFEAEPKEWGGDGFFGRAGRYGQSKLANSVFTNALATKQSKVKALVAHPGVCDSNLGARTGESGEQSYLLKIFVKFATGESMNSKRQSQEDGTCGILSAACLTEVQSGQMWGPKGDATRGPAVPSTAAGDFWFGRSLKMATKRLWDVSIKSTGATFSF
eukprot:CAMPEP_0119369038 /NCGR_PEP_ID=MMETSP1334-20130426/15618_1 /TAXON_ID=127549 /ORGANISM="Calcidiscus leptoporus, Strain RCC1130" /LENGTH=339 /DNA_ID=CAMNT_0007385807 /DNA_START=27 /DNA_END=1046 /DNA_ORIENTATION=-